MGPNSRRPRPLDTRDAGPRPNSSPRAERTTCRRRAEREPSPSRWDDLEVATALRPAASRLRTTRRLAGCLTHEPVNGLFDEALDVHFRRRGDRRSAQNHTQL